MTKLEDMQRILQKVAHLRALAARAGTSAEAEAAATQADAILQKYRLSEAEVEATGRAAEEGPEVAIDPLCDMGKSMQRWKSSLAWVISKHYGCYSWIDRKRSGGGFEASVRIRIVGRASDIEAARYMFAWAATEIDRLSLRETGKAARNGFRMGAVVGFLKALKAGQKLAETTSSASSAMVLVTRLDLAKAEAERAIGGKFSKSAPARYVNGSAFSRGVQAGEGMHTGRSLTPGSGRLLNS